MGVWYYIRVNSSQIVDMLVVAGRIFTGRYEGIYSADLYMNDEVLLLGGSEFSGKFLTYVTATCWYLKLQSPTSLVVVYGTLNNAQVSHCNQVTSMRIYVYVGEYVYVHEYVSMEYV